MDNYEEKNVIGKWIKRTLIFLILLFGMYVLFCYVYKTLRYKPFKEAETRFYDEKKSGEYDGFTVNASPSDEMLSFGGNLAVCQTRYFDVDNMQNGEAIPYNDTVDLLIYPELFGGYITIAMIEPASGNGASIKLDEKMRLLSSEYADFYKKYYDLIKKDYLIANKVFGIYDLSGI